MSEMWGGGEGLSHPQVSMEKGSHDTALCNSQDSIQVSPASQAHHNLASTYIFLIFYVLNAFYTLRNNF